MKLAKIEFGPEQLEAIDKAYDWYKNGKFIDKRLFLIEGYAGTGKSTVLSQILANMEIPIYKVAFVTFTGKAAVVLREKGNPATTIHRLIYNTSIGDSGKPIFRLKRKIPSNIELICVDEVGMVPEDMFEDLFRFQTPVLGLGDPGQLAPIFGENKYMRYPDVLLTQVYRQSEGSSILEVATDTRNDVNIYEKADEYKGGDVKIYKNLSDFDFKTMTDYDQIIVATNALKDMINLEYRKLKGYTSKYPVEGEKLICIRNNFRYPLKGKHDVELFLVNGMQVNVASPFDYYSGDYYGILEFTSPYTVGVSRVKVDAKSLIHIYDDIGEEKEKSEERKENQIDDTDSFINYFDYGYAITCHKSQGSEWDNVLVIDNFSGRSSSRYTRWLYTAVTRAKKNLTVVNAKELTTFDKKTIHYDDYTPPTIF